MVSDHFFSITAPNMAVYKWTKSWPKFWHIWGVILIKICTRGTCALDKRKTPSSQHRTWRFRFWKIKLKIFTFRSRSLFDKSLCLCVKAPRHLCSFSDCVSHKYLFAWYDFIIRRMFNNKYKCTVLHSGARPSSSSHWFGNYLM